MLEAEPKKPILLDTLVIDAIDPAVAAADEQPTEVLASVLTAVPEPAPVAAAAATAAEATPAAVGFDDLVGAPLDAAEAEAAPAHASTIVAPVESDEDADDADDALASLLAVPLLADDEDARADDEDAAAAEPEVERAVLEPEVVETAVLETEVVETAVLESEILETTVVEPEAGRAASAAAGDDALDVTASRERRRRLVRAARPAPGTDRPDVLEITGLTKRFGHTVALEDLDLTVRVGSFTGIVGPNGAGKTTALSMVAGLLRPDSGTVLINGIDAWKHPRKAKRITGVVPDRLRTFDRLTGEQLLYSTGLLRGLDRKTARTRADDLAVAFGIEDAIDRLVADYSAGMTKKIALASAMIHAPRLLVLDEPFEGVDPVSAATMTQVLVRYAKAGGTVLLSSHSMDLIERVCDSAVVIVAGRILASGTLDEVRDGLPLEDRFVELAGGRQAAEGMEWLHSFSD
nr:ABC transporter ATP-binding protein [Agromyces seonyuensis]